MSSPTPQPPAEQTTPAEPTTDFRHPEPRKGPGPAVLAALAGLMVLVLVIGLALALIVTLGSDEDNASTAAPPAAAATASATVTTASPTGMVTTTVTATATATPPTSIVAPAAAPCDEAAINAAANKPTSNWVFVERCHNDAWAYVSTRDRGDAQSIYRKLGGIWYHYSGFPSTICRADALAAGVPVEEASSFTSNSCEGATPSSAPSASGDLGLAIPMSRPACDGTGVVFVYAAVTPGSYESEVSSALSSHPGAQYLRTDQTCPSLRQSLNGNPIYAVYYPVGPSQAAVCQRVAAIGGDAYGKWLDYTTDPDLIISC